MVVAVITRKSSRDENKVSVSRQEAIGREWAATHRPGQPVAVFEDNATSGVKMDRPGWLAFVDAVRAGAVTDVWAYEQSRLTRAGGGAWDDVCSLLSAAGIREVHTDRQGTISVVEGDRIHGRLNSVMDQHEREIVVVRTRDALHRLAVRGLPSGATGYGYARSYDAAGKPVLHPHPTQAATAAWMVQCVADGWSLGAVADKLNADGVPTSRGAAMWRREAVKSVVASPRLIGQRVHRGRVIGPATWEPVVDRAVWERAQARLNRRPGRTADQRRLYLLTGGTARCAGCDTPLISATTPVRGERVPSYQCPHPSRGGCGHCSILASRLEDHVSEVIAGWLTDPDFAAALTERLSSSTAEAGPLRVELDKVDGMLADLAVRWASGDLLELEHAAARRTLVARRGELVDALTVLAPRVEVTPELLVAAWESGDPARRRDVAQVLARVRVRGAFAGGRRLAVEERVDVVPAWPT